jgi:hypothetical protein
MSEIHQLKYQRGFIFNGFRPNSQRWKYAILTTFFIGFVFAHFLSIWHEEDIIQQLKAWSFRMWKNLVHTQSNSDTIARWSSITFFFIHPVQGESKKPDTFDIQMNNKGVSFFLLTLYRWCATTPMGFKRQSDFRHAGWNLHCKQAKSFVNVIQHGDGDVTCTSPIAFLLVYSKFINFFHVFYIYRTAKDLERYKI